MIGICNYLFGIIMFERNALIATCCYWVYLFGVANYVHHIHWIRNKELRDKLYKTIPTIFDNKQHIKIKLASKSKSNDKKTN